MYNEEADLHSASIASVYTFSSEDEMFLDDLEHRIFNYFWNNAYSKTGIAFDHSQNRIGKVAATGFEMVAVCIAVERNFLDRKAGYERCLKILDAFWDDPNDPDDAFVDGKFGLYWHFIDGNTGKMKPIDCVAMCDSADFIAGALIAGEYFKGTEVDKLAQKIYDGVEWDKFVINDGGKPGLLSFGWVPPNVSKTYYHVDGLLGPMHGFEDNSLLIYALALGSDTHPCPEQTWELYVDSYNLLDYSGYSCVAGRGTFIRQVPQAFIPFSRLRDRKIDYFTDTVRALLADRIFNMRENSYPPQVWGLNDCFGEETYSHSAPPGPIVNDGTVSTTSFVGALPHLPRLSLNAMRYAYKNFGSSIYGKYGFKSSINLLSDYISPLYVGIELGPMIMLIENARSGLIWKLMAQTSVMKNFVKRAGMSGVIDDFEMPSEGPAYAKWEVFGAEALKSDSNPQHGNWCYEIKRPKRRTITIRASLPDNNLLKYFAGKAVSVWTRDCQISSASAILNGQTVTLTPVATVLNPEWNHHYFSLGGASSSSAISSITFELTLDGEHPAIDNISFEPVTSRLKPKKIKDFSITKGPFDGSVTLQWQLTSSGNLPTHYIVRVEDASSIQSVRELTILADTCFLSEDGVYTQTVPFRKLGKYKISIASVDGYGHKTPFLEPKDFELDHTPYGHKAYNFEDNNLTGVNSLETQDNLSIVELNPGNKCLKVDFYKGMPWHHIVFKLDPDKAKAFSCIQLKIRGKVNLLAKYWSRKDLQTDICYLDSKSDTEWTIFTIDPRIENKFNPKKEPLNKLYLFIDPPTTSRNGTFYIDNIEYSN